MTKIDKVQHDRALECLENLKKAIAEYEGSEEDGPHAAETHTITGRAIRGTRVNVSVGEVKNVAMLIKEYTPWVKFLEPGDALEFYNYVQGKLTKWEKLNIYHSDASTFCSAIQDLRGAMEDLKKARAEAFWQPEIVGPKDKDIKGVPNVGLVIPEPKKQ